MRPSKRVFILFYQTTIGLDNKHTHTQRSIIITITYNRNIFNVVEICDWIYVIKLLGFTFIDKFRIFT